MQCKWNVNTQCLPYDSVLTLVADVSTSIYHRQMLSILYKKVNSFSKMELFSHFKVFTKAARLVIICLSVYFQCIFLYLFRTRLFTRCKRTQETKNQSV